MPLSAEPEHDNPLWAYFSSNPGRLIHKWHHYFEIYHRHFARFRDRPVKVLEIGVLHGGSLQMWKHYFGPQAVIYGMDVNPRCRGFAEEQIQIVIGDQADRPFLRELQARIAPIDILIDDGGHRPEEQIATFEELYPAVSETGIYLVEDLHTSYWDKYGGGFKRPGTFIEYAKALIDRLNAWHARDPQLPPCEFTKSTGGMYFYGSVLVIEKQSNRAPPKSSKTGVNSFGVADTEGTMPR